MGDGQNELLKDFTDLLTSAVKETGKELAVSASELASYMAQRASHLSTMVGTEDFGAALIVERDNVALRGGLAASLNADRFDNRIVGIVQGALQIGARLLAV